MNYTIDPILCDPIKVNPRMKLRTFLKRILKEYPNYSGIMLINLWDNRDGRKYSPFDSTINFNNGQLKNHKNKNNELELCGKDPYRYLDYHVYKGWINDEYKDGVRITIAVTEKPLYRLKL